MTLLSKPLVAAACFLALASPAGAQDDGSADPSSFPKPKLVVPTNSTYSKYHMDLSKIKSTRAAPELTVPAVTQSTATAKPKTTKAKTPASPRPVYRGSSSKGTHSSTPEASTSESAVSSELGISAQAAMAVSGAGAFSVSASKPAAPAQSSAGSKGGGPSGSSSSGPQCSITPTDGSTLKCDNFWKNQGYIDECKKKASNCTIGKNSVCTPQTGDNGRGLFISCL